MSASPSLGNISGEVSVHELLSNHQLIPGLRGATLKVEKGTAIRFADIFQLTINRGVEFLLTREVRKVGHHVVRHWRIYSGTAEDVLPPRFYDSHGPAGETTIERVVGHTHPRPIPFEVEWNQPSAKDIINLRRAIIDWQQLHGPRSEPFARIIWGLEPGEPTIYGIESTPGNAIPPPWLRK